MNKLQKFFNNICRLIAPRSHVRCYSRYPPHFIEPVTDKSELDKMMQELKPVEIKMKSVKAAKHSATCSVFFDPDIHLLTQRLIRNGDRRLAQSLVDKTLEQVKRIQLEKYYSCPVEDRDKIELNPKVIFHKAVENLTPVLGTKIVKRSGTFYTIPAMVTKNRAKFLALKFLIEAGDDKDRKVRFYDSLALELIKAFENRGKAVQRKIDLHKYCEANRAYAHYRWT